MSTILSMDTATNAGSAAIHRSGQLIGLQQYNIEKSHSSLQHVLIEQLLDNSGIKLDEIDAIAVSAGPGSYTGLRIGVSTAKGLCFALDKPLIAVNTLEAMAKQATSHCSEEVLLCPMIDARRLEVYCLMTDHKMNIRQETKAVVVDEHSFASCLQERRVLFLGDGAPKCREVIRHEHAAFIDNVMPSAKEVGELAHQKYEKAQFEDPAYYEPFYLKDFRVVKSKKKL